MITKTRYKVIIPNHGWSNQIGNLVKNEYCNYLLPYHTCLLFEDGNVKSFTLDQLEKITKKEKK